MVGQVAERRNEESQRHSRRLSVNQSLSFAAVLVASFQPEDVAERVESVMAPESGGDE